MEKSKSTNKKGQIWGLDLVIAAAIFSVTLAFFYIYTMNQSAETESLMETLAYEGGIITDTLLSEGYPENWNETNVIQLGILSEGKINETKIEKFYNMSIDNYFTLKTTLNTRYNFYFFLDEKININSNSIDGIGMAGINRTNLTAENIIKINRVTIYQDKPMGAHLYIWQ